MKRTTDLRALTIDELMLEEKSLRKELFNLKFQKKTGEIENPMRIRHVRKDISRILTIITEKSQAKS